MYPIQTQQHKIIRILLILFIINQVANFAFGAPVAVREKLEGCIDADGTDDGTLTLQKRVNPVEKGSMNMAGQTPPGSDRTEADRLWEGMGQLGTDLKPRHIPTSRTSLFGKRAPPPPTKRPTKERLQPAPLLTTNNPSTTSHQLIPQQNSGSDLDVHPPPNLEPQPLEKPPPNSGPHPSTSGEMPVDEVWNILKDSKLKRTFPAPVL
ncbi:hypothetical protein BGY98DRAFT_227792 [Russula aff. rugulosa BPL654]|nr:hypothetical protein BGY98DRAFT_227792 [Russula aff. rugulosa BPL654]